MAISFAASVFLCVSMIASIASGFRINSKQLFSCNARVMKRLHSATSSASHQLSALVAVADGTEEMEAVTVIDTLARAGVRVVVGSVMDKPHVVCSHGVKLMVDTHVDQCVGDHFDVIVCPGGMPGATHLSESRSLASMLTRQASEGKLVAAICASPAVVLAHHHLLRDKRATAYPADKFVSAIPHYSDEEVVRDGNIITSKGPATSLPFALCIVEALCGVETADRLRKDMIWKH